MTEVECVTWLRVQLLDCELMDCKCSRKMAGVGIGGEKFEL